MRSDEESHDFGEQYDYSIVDLELNWNLARNAAVFIGYAYTWKDSEVPDRGFSRNRAWLGMDWDF